MADHKVEVVLKHAAKMIGEGPHWEEKSGKLLFVDIYSNTAHKFNPDSQQIESSITTSGPLSLIVPTNKPGKYIVSSERRLCQVDWETNALENIVEVPAIGSADRFNDGKCDTAGRLWAGTMGVEKVAGQPEPDKGRLFSLERSQLKTKVSPVSISNGLAWSSDNTTMYYIDSVPRCVYSYRYDASTGEIGDKQVVVDYNQWSIEEAGLPDGMCIDQQDKLWVAGYYSGKVAQFDPETGKMLRTVEVPGKWTTSCCFGGKDYSELYVTSAAMGYTEEEMKKKDPLAGSLFRVTGLGVKGMPAHNYQI